MSRNLLVLSALFGCATGVRAAEPEQVVWDARYQVRFGETAEGVPEAEVDTTLQCKLEASACPKAVVVDMDTEDEFPKGYGSFVRGFRAIPTDGAASPGQQPAVETISVPDGRYRVPLRADGSAHFHYKVVLEHDASDWGPGPDEAPYRFDGGAFWTGRALFITAPGSQAEVSFTAPEGRRVSTSFEPVPGRAGTYTVPRETRLRDSFLVVGDTRESKLIVDQAQVVLVLGGGLRDSMPVLEQAIRRFLEASKGVFGGAPPRTILVAGNLGASPGSLYGGVFANDVSFLADEALGASNEDRWRPFLCHEIFHLWNGTAIDFPDGQQYWFTEGATEYYANLLPVRLGDVGAEQFLQTLSAKAAEYLEAAGPVGLQAAGNEKFLSRALVYEGGSLAALSLDLQIRAASSNRKSLDDVMKALYQESQSRNGKGLRMDDVVQAASTAAGRPMDEFFRRHVLGSEELPLADSLKRAGLRLDAEIAEWPDAKAILGQLLRCPSVNVVSNGILVNVSRSEPIRAGDILVAVAGSPVGTVDDLRRAFRDRGPASRVSISVIRDGKTIDLDVVLGGKEGDSVSRSRHAQVRVDVLPDADPLALEIRKSLLGI